MTLSLLAGVLADHPLGSACNNPRCLDITTGTAYDYMPWRGGRTLEPPPTFLVVRGRPQAANKRPSPRIKLTRSARHGLMCTGMTLPTARGRASSTRPTRSRATSSAARSTCTTRRRSRARTSTCTSPPTASSTRSSSTRCAHIVILLLSLALVPLSLARSRPCCALSALRAGAYPSPL